MSSFGGSTFDEDLDGDRLRIQLAAVWRFMFDKQWHTLREISAAVDAPEASVSARLRDFRKDKFGGYIVERQRIPNGNGLHIYRIPRGQKDDRRGAPAIPAEGATAEGGEGPRAD